MALVTNEARRWAEQAFPPHTVTVSRTDIARYARAIGETDPIHFDREVAVAAGHRDVVAPVYFPYTLRVQATTLAGDLEPDGSSSAEVPPLPARRAMAGETAIEFGSDICAGDAITIDKRIVDLTEKHGRSGPLALVTTEFTFHNQEGDLVMRERFTRIYR
ncbi:MAG TPA: MaoC family dehydratase N-terminal domain-containing protein [Acidimicrobiia bacterium]